MDDGDEAILAFDEAVAMTLREMAGVECALRDRRQVTGGEFAGLTALLRLMGGKEGYLALSCPASVAAELARKVFAESGTEPEAAMIRDCVGEVANVIAGQAKTRLYGTPQHFTLSPPVFGLERPPDTNASRWVLTYSSEIGDFTVCVRLPAAAE